MSDCIFCDIVAGRATASIVFRDGLCCAFMDTQPVNPGHVLIVPNKHVPSIDDLDEKVGGHLFAIAQRITRALLHSGIRCEGVCSSPTAKRRARRCSTFTCSDDAGGRHMDRERVWAWVSR